MFWKISDTSGCARPWRSSAAAFGRRPMLDPLDAVHDDHGAAADALRGKALEAMKQVGWQLRKLYVEGSIPFTRSKPLTGKSRKPLQSSGSVG